MKFSVKNTCICAICIALCCVLPIAFHAFGLGYTFSPMHIPVLLCGLVCGGVYGLICGIVGPVLSCLITGMPGAVQLINMVPELAVYGLVAGLGMKLIRTGHLQADLYISLVAAMLLGRVVGGIAQALFYLGSGESFGIAAWATAYFVNTLPGIICHLIVVPILVNVLMQAKAVPKRYASGAGKHSI